MRAANPSPYDAAVVEHAVMGAARQRMLEGLVHGCKWTASLEAGLITFGGLGEYRVQVIGTWGYADDTFEWAWSNPAAAGWEPSLEVARHARELGRQRDWGLFDRERVAGAWVNPLELAYVCGELHGGLPLHVGGYDGGSFLMLVDIPVDGLKLPFAALSGVLLGFQERTLTQVRPCAERFLERLGYSLERGPTHTDARRHQTGASHIERARLRWCFASGRLDRVELDRIPLPARAALPA